jgi:hypothetical protein
MKWFYAKGGSQQGPVDADELRAKVATGEVAPSDLVWREGMRDWAPLGDVPELSGYLAAPAAPAQVPAAPASPYQPPRSDPARAVTMPSGPLAPIPNYLWQSIVVTILCCWPFGIPAIINAAKVEGLVARGDRAAAELASKNARMWCWVAFGSGLAVLLLYGAFVAISIASGNMN